jgi:small subunit ribosomal protein S7
MPRRRVIEKRAIIADPVYGSQLLAKFINHLMTGGKKSVAEKVVYGALDVIHTRLKRDPLSVLEKALNHIQPMVEVKSRRVGGATYQVPVEVSADRAMALAMRWLVQYSRERGERGMMLKLAGEIMDAADEEGGSKGKGGAVKKREDTHRMAEANRAFSHYRW